MHKAKRRFLSSLLLGLFAFTSLAPRTFADATDRDEGFYDQTYEINNNRLSFDGSSQNSSWSGAYSFSLPLTVPSGRNGLQPSLALSYNSQSSEWDSFYGAGWSLGIPSITRINKTGLNNLYEETYFSSSLGGELVNETGTPYGDYAAKVEDGSFLTYEFNSDDSWTVTDKSGTVYTFGADTNSRQDDSADTTRIYKWMLEEVRDTNNNYVRYEYFKENGQIYPETISYTGSGSTDGIFSVDFTLEARSDSSTFFNTGFEVQTDYRVSEISASVNGTERRSYALAYGAPDDTERSLLQSVTESAVSESGATTTLPATSFEYGEAAKGWTETSGYNIPVYFYAFSANTDRGVETADVNGDGLLDLLNSSYIGSEYDHVYLNAGDGTGWFEDSAYDIPVYFYNSSTNLMKDTRMADFNGDGLSDIFYGTSGTNTLYKADKDSYTWTEETASPPPQSFNGGYTLDYGVRLLDVNGDGFPDYIQSVASSSGVTTQSVYLYDPDDKTWIEETSFSIPSTIYFNDLSSSNMDAGILLADVNGDSLVDMVRSRSSSGTTQQAVYINQGDLTWAEDPNYIIPVTFWDASGSAMEMAQMVDVDGDGLADIVLSSTSPTHDEVYINKGDGTGWEEDTSYTVPLPFNSGPSSYEGVQIFDVNGDNFADMVQSKYYPSSNSALQSVYLNNATPELLETITHSSGATTTVAYAPSTEFNNPNMPFVTTLVSSITTEDGLGDTATTSFDYEGGAYLYEDEFNRQFAGFSSVTKTEDGRVTETFYEQDDLALLGRAYQTDIYDDSGNLYTRSIDTWATTDLGYDNDFVYKTQTATLTYDGSSTHRDTGTAYTYDSNGNVSTVINYGEVTASTDGTFTDVTDVDEKYTVTYLYATDTSGGEIRNKVKEEKVTNSSGSTLKWTRYYYDSLAYGSVSTGNLTRDARRDDNASLWYSLYYTYNSYGRVTRATNMRGYNTNFTYDTYYLYPSVTTNPKGYTVSTEYDYATGQMTSRTDENGITSETAYDGLGRVTTVSVPNPTTGTLSTLSTSTYDDTSTPTSVSTTSTVGTVTSESVTYFDGFGRTVQSNTLAEGGVYTTVDTFYDSLGNVSQQSLPYETSSSTFGRDDSEYGVTSTYDALNRPLTVTSPTGTTSYSYSQWENTVTDANSVSKVYNYDSAGHLLSVEEQNDGDTYTSTYEYDPLGQLITLTDAQGNERNFDYDSLGRKLSQEDLHDPSETSFGTWTYTYDKNNNLLTQTDPSGQVITWAYDSLDRVSYEDWDTSTTTRNVIYTYDTATRGKMHLYQVSVGTGAEYIHRFQTYDYLGNPTKDTYYIMKPGLTTYNYYDFFNTYDLLSRTTQTIYPANMLKINYKYNALGAVESIDRGATGTDYVVSDFDYSPMGQVESITYANGVTVTNTYDPAEAYRLTNKTATGTYNSTTGSVQDLTYTYDSVGNITGIVDSSITPTNKTLTYTYDDLNRLLTAASSGLSAGDYSESYTYDEVGNMTYKSDVGTMTYTGTGSGGTNPHAVTSVNGTAYTYDDNGNLTSNGAHTYSWDKRNRLSSSGSKTFYYDGGGSRYKTVDSSSGTNEYTYYVSPLYELRDGTTTDDGNPTYYIFAGGQRVAALEDTDADGNLENTERSYYVQDHLGGTALVTDSTGIVTQLYDYYPYGSELLDSQPTGADVPSEHSFTDKELDDDLGLYYFEARWYDSSIGRFSGQDPAQWNQVEKLLVDPQQLNFYTYSRNNPVVFIDENGELIGLAAAFLGAVLISAFTGVQYAGDSGDGTQVKSNVTIASEIAISAVAYVSGVKAIQTAATFYGAANNLTSQNLSYEERLNDFIGSGDKLKNTRGPSDVYSKNGGGGYSKALDDFQSLAGDSKIETKVNTKGESFQQANMSNGDTIILRDFSSDAQNPVTIEIQHAGDSLKTKMRYGE